MNLTWPSRLLGLIVVVLLLWWLAPVAIVPAGYRGVLTTFGKADEGVLDPGIHLRFPVAQTLHLMDVRLQKGEAEGDAASRDLQSVHTRIAINYHLLPGAREGIEEKRYPEAEKEITKIAKALQDYAAAIDSAASDLEKLGK